MPDPAKAILDPVAPLPVSQAVMVAVCGMVIVFIMLVILALVIWVVSKMVNGANSSSGSAASAEKPATATKPASVPATPAQDPDELVAVLMAAIAEESGMPVNSFQISNVSSMPVAAPAAAGPSCPCRCVCPRSRCCQCWRDCGE